MRSMTLVAVRHGPGVAELQRRLGPGLCDHREVAREFGIEWPAGDGLGGFTELLSIGPA